MINIILQMQISTQLNINIISSSTYTVIIINLFQQSKTVLVEADGYQRYKTQKKAVKSPSSFIVKINTTRL